MTTTKIYSGLYQVQYNNRVFKIENMKEWGQGWQVRDEDGDWLTSYDTKWLCQDWIERIF